jgi:hypothetical protein
MAKTIGQLTQATTIGGSDEFVIEQTGITKRVAASVVRGGLVNTDVASNAAIAFSKLAALDSANILVGNGSNVATKVAVSGDATLSNAGAVTLAAASITGKTQLADPLASGDEFLVHDTSASALRRVAWSALQPAGSVIKTEYAQLVGVQSYTSGQTLAVGATPTITSGVEILAINSLSAASASNYLVITANALISASSGNSVILMLFAGNTLVATANITGSNQASIMTLVYKHSPASTSAVNYTVRAACESGTLYVNRLYTVTDYNTGKQVSSMLIQEIKG